MEDNALTSLWAIILDENAWRWLEGIEKAFVASDTRDMPSHCNEPSFKTLKVICIVVGMH